MPLAWDAAGQLIPPGKVVRTMNETFMLGTMPTWLTAASGTASYGAQASTRGYLQMATSTVNGNKATVQTSFSINLADQKAILWETFGLVYDSATVQISMGIAASGSVGSYIRQDYTESQVNIVMAGSSQAQNYDIRTSGEATRRRNLGLCLLPATREMYILEDDQVMAYRQHTSINLGAVTASLDVVTREAVAHNFQVSRLQLTLFHD